MLKNKSTLNPDYGMQSEIIFCWGKYTFPVTNIPSHFLNAATARELLSFSQMIVVENRGGSNAGQDEA